MGRGGDQDIPAVKQQTNRVLNEVFGLLIKRSNLFSVTRNEIQECEEHCQS